MACYKRQWLRNNVCCNPLFCQALQPDDGTHGLGGQYSQCLALHRATPGEGLIIHHRPSWNGNDADVAINENEQRLLLQLLFQMQQQQLQQPTANL